MQPGRPTEHRHRMRRAAPHPRRTTWTGPAAYPACAAALAWLAAAAPATAGQQIGSATLDRTSGSKVTIDSAFGDIPTHGFAAVRVTFENGTDDDRTLTLRFNTSASHRNGSGNYSSSFQVSAGARKTAVHELMVPVATIYNSQEHYRGALLSVSVNGGLGFDSPTFREYGELSDLWPSLAVSSSIATKNLAALNKRVEDRRSSLPVDNSRFGVDFEPGELPSDWRGYTGYDVILMTASDWQSLASGARSALGDWLRLGGELHIYTDSDAVDVGSLDLGLAPGSRDADAGLGAVRVLAWDGDTLDPDGAYNRYSNLWGKRHAKVNRIDSDYRSDWVLSQWLGTRSSGGWHIAAVLVLFGVLVGPVNLFVFAKPGRRHRLFITTPLISLATSILLVAFIFFQDGTGGDGKRFALMQVDPGSRQAHLIQEQLCRTGVVFGKSFTPEDDVFISPVVTRPGQWATVSDRLGGAELEYSLSGSTYTGDWFRSRAEQGHYLEAVRPTRGRIERVGSGPGGAPVVLSSFDFPLDALSFRDPDGNTWVSPQPLQAGVRTQLVEAPDAHALARDPFSGVDPEHRPSPSASLLARVRDLSARDGTFLAVASPGKAPFIETSPAIDWEDGGLVVHGPVDDAPATAD